MMNSLSQGKIKQEDTGGYYVVDAADPKTLTDATGAVYMISEKFPSPMGADLSAFANRTSAEEFQKNFGGEIKSWDEILQKFKVNQ
jgi:copper chaperone NosL